MITAKCPKKSNAAAIAATIYDEDAANPVPVEGISELNIGWWIHRSTIFFR